MESIEEDLIFEEISRILRIPVRFRQDSHILALMNHTKNVQFFKTITSEQNS